jgi:hypothetical protein
MSFMANPFRRRRWADRMYHEAREVPGEEPRH